MDAELLVIIVGALVLLFAGLWRFYAVARFVRRVLRGKK